MEISLHVKMERNPILFSSKEVFQIILDQGVIKVQAWIGMRVAVIGHPMKAKQRRQLTYSFLEPLQAVQFSIKRTVDKMMAILMCELVDPLAPVIIFGSEKDHMYGLMLATHWVFIAMDDSDRSTGERRPPQRVGKPDVNMLEEVADNVEIELSEPFFRKIHVVAYLLAGYFHAKFFISAFFRGVRLVGLFAPVPFR